METFDGVLVSIYDRGLIECTAPDGHVTLSLRDYMYVQLFPLDGFTESTQGIYVLAWDGVHDVPVLSVAAHGVYLRGSPSGGSGWCWDHAHRVILCRYDGGTADVPMAWRRSKLITWADLKPLLMAWRDGTEEECTAGLLGACDGEAD